MSGNQLTLPLDVEPDKIIRCPLCGYSPVFMPGHPGVYGVPPKWNTSGDDWPTWMQLEFFNVAGSEDGFVSCGECACEFSLETGEAADDICPMCCVPRGEFCCCEEDE